MGCKHCETACQDGCEAKGKKFAWTDIVTCFATRHTRKKLLRKTVTKKIPSYRWVVENLCDQCQSKTESTLSAAGVDMPLPGVANNTHLPTAIPTLNSSTDSLFYDDPSPADKTLVPGRRSDETRHSSRRRSETYGLRAFQ